MILDGTSLAALFFVTFERAEVHGTNVFAESRAIAAHTICEKPRMYISFIQKEQKCTNCTSLNHSLVLFFFNELFYRKVHNFLLFVFWHSLNFCNSYYRDVNIQVKPKTDWKGEGQHSQKLYKDPISQKTSHFHTFADGNMALPADSGPRQALACDARAAFPTTSCATAATAPHAVQDAVLAASGVAGSYALEVVEGFTNKQTLSLCSYHVPR